MIKHIVMWTFKDNANSASKQENMILVKEKLEALKTIVPEIKELEVGLNFNPAAVAYDLVLYSTVETKDDLAIYQNNPDHCAVKKIINEVTEDRVVVDYEI